MMRATYLFTGAALALAAATAFITLATVSGAELVARPLVALTLLVFGGFLFLGSKRWIGLASLPMFGTVVVEAGFADKPSWIRSILLGCLWFLSLEAAWEAIDRRDGRHYSSAANARRAQEVVTVLALALAVGVIAVAATSLAPVRSVLLQALVLGGLLTAFVRLIRAAAPARPRQ